MDSLALLHGTGAILVLAILLFVEEAGVPLPFAPGDLVLVVGGLLVAGGTVSPWLLGPALATGAFSGALVGFSWSAALGTDRLHRVARRLRIEAALTQTERRLRTSGSAGIAMLRFVPGLRVYSTLVLGALRVERRTFVRGLAPAVLLWVAGLIALGWLAGAPVEAALHRLDHLAVTAGLGLAGLAVLVGAARLWQGHRRQAASRSLGLAATSATL